MYRHQANVSAAISVIVMFAYGACRDSAEATRDDIAAREDASTGDTGGPSSEVSDPERYWLDAIGNGPAQLRSVCERGAKDQVTSAFCAESPPKLSGLADLYEALGMKRGERFFAVASSSSGLSFQTVFALNPRVIVTTLADGPGSKQTLDHFVITAFVRGEQQVELVAYDQSTAQLNFYLLAFNQECNRTRCSPVDLISLAIENNWLGYTLYRAADLEDTPLDCRSCHQPDGPGTPDRLLMRDLQDPWFHWLPPTKDQSLCPDGRTPELAPDLRAVFEHAHSSSGRYGGVALEELAFSTGHNLFSSLVLFSDLRRPLMTLTETFVMPSRKVVDDWRCDHNTATWRGYREPLRATALPVPYFAFDGLDTERSRDARNDLQTHVMSRNNDEPFDVLSDLVSNVFKQAVGAVPDDGVTDGHDLLNQMCSRCHDDKAPADSRRALFHVDHLTNSSAAEASRRITLPLSSPFAMPPRRAGVLGERKRDQLRAFLDGR